MILIYRIKFQISEISKVYLFAFDIDYVILLKRISEPLKFKNLAGECV